MDPALKSRLFPFHQVRALESSDNLDRRWIIVGDVHGCIRELEDLLGKVIRIDTGCVWGGKLTAYILPEKSLVQVDARENYIQ